MSTSIEKDVAGIEGGGLELNPVSGWIGYTDDLEWQGVVATDSVGPFGYKNYASGGTGSFVGGETGGRDGIFSFGGGSSGGHYSTIGNSSLPVLLGGASHLYGAAIKLSAAPNGTDDFIVGVGFSGSVTSTFHSDNDHALILIKRSLDATNIYVSTRDNGGTAETADTGVTIASASSDYTNFQVLTSSSDIKYYINGTLVHTETTAYPDTNSMSPIFGAAYVSGSQVTHKADWYQKYKKPDSALGSIAPWVA